MNWGLGRRAVATSFLIAIIAIILLEAFFQLVSYLYELAISDPELIWKNGGVITSVLFAIIAIMALVQNYRMSVYDTEALLIIPGDKKNVRYDPGRDEVCILLKNTGKMPARSTRMRHIVSLEKPNEVFDENHGIEDTEIKSLNIPPGETIDQNIKIREDIRNSPNDKFYLKFEIKYKREQTIFFFKYYSEGMYTMTYIFERKYWTSVIKNNPITYELYHLYDIDFK